MRRDALPILLRLRRMEMDHARADLLAAEARVGETRQAAQAARLAILREMLAASAMEADDSAVQAFANWLSVGRATQTRAEAELRRAEEDSIRARTCFNLARTAAESVGKLIDQRNAAEQRVDRVTEQMTMDEVASRRSG